MPTSGVKETQQASWTSQWSAYRQTKPDLNPYIVLFLINKLVSFILQLFKNLIAIDMAPWRVFHNQSLIFFKKKSSAAG
jgi:hypothetical protein